ncbi:MAG: hypothetical protein HKN58_01680, partial [Xanthomonadales bacterium]|nr:hypothetical protein [Xanthomonadales bacterium]
MMPKFAMEQVYRNWNKALAAGLGLLVAVAVAPAAASPVQVIECQHSYLDGPTPYELIDSNYTVRRHIVETAPSEAVGNEYWAQGVFEQNGSIDVIITPFGGDPIALEASSVQTTILDGKINFSDTYLDEAPSGSLDYGIEGWELDSFALILRKQDGSQIEDHLVVPPVVVREEWDPYLCTPEGNCAVECALIWRVPGGSMPCSGQTGGGGICTTGRYIGRVTSTSLEDHEADHGAGFAINAGLNDAWVTAQAPFQGLFVTVYEALGLVFVAWFTFDVPEAEAAMSPQSLQSMQATATFGAEDQRWV